MSIFRCGEVYAIDDAKIRFTGNEGRTPAEGLKNTRYVLVVQEDVLLENDEYIGILVAPFSTRSESQVKDTYDLPFIAGEGGLTCDCYCCLGHLQSVQKVSLKPDIYRQPIGFVPSNRIEEVKISLIDMLGLREYI